MTDLSRNSSMHSRTTSSYPRSTVRVRNVAEGVVYHLTFDGDLGRLTGRHLKQHVESIAGIAASSQLLSIDGKTMEDETNAASVGIRDGTTVTLELKSRGGSHHRVSASAARHRSMESSAARRSQPRPYTTGPSASAYAHHPAASTARRSPSRRRIGAEFDDTDDDDTQIEVHVEEDVTAVAPTSTYVPVRASDIDEQRLQQQDYIWKMEQVRFETERMTREREMRRQQQELEYQAALLDRSRVEVERKTRHSRLEFEEMQLQQRIDLDIEAKSAPTLLNLHSGNQQVHTGYTGALSAMEVPIGNTTTSGLLP